MIKMMSLAILKKKFVLAGGLATKCHIRLKIDIVWIGRVRKGILGLIVIWSPLIVEVFPASIAVKRPFPNLKSCCINLIVLWAWKLREMLVRLELWVKVIGWGILWEIKLWSFLTNKKSSRLWNQRENPLQPSPTMISFKT